MFALRELILSQNYTIWVFNIRDIVPKTDKQVQYWKLCISITAKLQLYKEKVGNEELMSNSISILVSSTGVDEKNISSIDFDVALIGCGAYGFPLGSYVKELGKIAVHMGGDLQMFFGIMGNRWENNPAAISRMNEYWIRPTQGEIVNNNEMIENGCYWWGQVGYWGR